MTSLELLVTYLQAAGSIRTARVSSAQARGNAKNYAYWGAVRYEVRLDCDGRPVNMPLERASSGRRSYRLAEADCKRLCEEEYRTRLDRIGVLCEEDADELIDGILFGSDDDPSCDWLAWGRLADV